MQTIRQLWQLKGFQHHILANGDGNLVDFNHIESILIKENFNEYQLTNVDIDGRRGHLNQDADKKIILFMKRKIGYCIVRNTFLG